LQPQKHVRVGIATRVAARHLVPHLARVADVGLAFRMVVDVTAAVARATVVVLMETAVVRATVVDAAVVELRLLNGP